MGQFKPMVKMMTDEPSVILKLKKGGKVAKKADGGFMPMASTMAARPPMDMAAPAGGAPMRPGMMARMRAMAGAKPGMAASRFVDPAISGRRSAIVPGMNPTMMKKGGKAEKHEDAAQDRAMIKKALAGKKFASGGEIDSAATKTTVKGNVGKFVKTKVNDGDKHDSAKGTTGVKMGKTAGYAMGGTIEGNAGKFAKTKVVDGDKHDSAKGTGGVKMGNRGGYAMGGSIKGGSNWENRPANTAKPGKSGTTTSGVRNGNAGGYMNGGAAKKAYATGGNVVDDGKAAAMPRKPVSRPVANSLQSGTFARGGKVEMEEKPNLRLIKTHTGPKGHVAKVYKDRDYGEHRVKFFDPAGKHMRNADYHTDDVSDAHDTATGQLSRYKQGGKAKKFEAGGSTSNDKLVVKDPKAVSDKASRELEDALNPLSMVQELFGKAKDYFTKPSSGSVTKTEKSVTVSPTGRKRGGSC
jgi:hypothetical protein